MRTAPVKRGLAVMGVVASAMVLSACSGGGGDDVVVTPPTPPATPRLEDGFGAGFASAYRAANTTDPRDPAAGDIIAVNAAADPVPIP